MRVLLTGATGFIGQHVCRRFVERGDEVVALVRSPEKAARLGGNVKLLKGDLSLFADPRTELPEVDVVVRGTATNSDQRRCFLRARVDPGPDGFVATLAAARSSGSLAGGAEVNAYVVVPESQSLVRDGDRLTAQILDWGDA